MHPHPSRLICCFLVAILASSTFAAPPPLPDLSILPDSLGVNIHFTDAKPGELDQIYSAGFRWVRMDFGWDGIERKKGDYDFSAYDRLIAGLDQHHMHAIFILDYGNRHYDGGASPSTDEGRAAFAKWAAASVHHFKGHGIFWEMWNEPNGGFWKPTRNVDDYIKLALATGKAIRDAEPGEIYIGPATSTIDMPYLETCFKAGCLEYWSAVSVHPYRQSDPETVADEYRALRRLIAKYAPAGQEIPIISGEWGYSSVWQNFDEERQAKYLPRELLTNIANGILLSIWYDWHEDGKDPKEPEHHFGIVKPDAVNTPGALYEEKDAYLAAAAMNTHLAGFRFSKRLFVGSRDDVVLLFDNGQTQRLVAWTTNPKHTEVNFPHISGSDTSLFGSRDGGKSFEQLLATFENGLVLTDSPIYYEPRKPNELLQVAAAWSRAPMELSIRGPAIAKVETTVSNPLSHAITIIHYQKRTELKAGESLSLASLSEAGRDRTAPPIDSELEVEGLGKITQRTVLAVSNPLSAIFFPRVGDSQQVRLENPSGDAIQARAAVTGADAFVPCDTADGQTEKILTLTFKNAPADQSTRHFALIADNNQNLLSADQPDLFVSLDLKNVARPGLVNYRWNLVADGDAKVASTQSLTQDNPPEGPPAPGIECMKIAYHFDAGWKFLRLAPYGSQTYRDPTGAGLKMGLWIHGDASGNIARMRFTDETGQTFQPDAGKITWKGWRYIEFNLTGHNTAHWAGKNDGVVHGGIKIETLFLLDSPARKATAGEIYLSSPTLVFSK